MNLDEKKLWASAWFEQLRDDICARFEALEQALEEGDTPAGQFMRTPWQRDEGGGGEMSVMKGRVFEKVGVNISTVTGEFSEQFRKEIPGAAEDPSFWASGISLVAHACSPLVPAAHFNTRMIVVGDGVRLWFGGGGDLTPTYPNAQDTADFHAALQAGCDTVDPLFYPAFKGWCDEYFFLPHRHEARGVGGIFYDYLGLNRLGEDQTPIAAAQFGRGGVGKELTTQGMTLASNKNISWEQAFAFTQQIGRCFKDIYSDLVARHLHETWTDEQREYQLRKRGRYVEYNLLYDRGTRFGLMTGGNTEAILMSLPPIVKWD